MNRQRMNRRDLYSVVLKLSEEFNAQDASEFVKLIQELTDEENKELEENGINLGGFTFWRHNQIFFWQKGWTKVVQQKILQVVKKGQEVNGFDMSPCYYLAYQKGQLISFEEGRGLLEANIYHITEFGRMFLTTQTTTWSTMVLLYPKPQHYSGGPRVPIYRFCSVPNQEFYLTIITLLLLGLSVLAAFAMIFS